MINKKERAYSHYSKDAAILLGNHIQLGRKRRRFTESDLADRVGISRTTLRKIEKGNLKCELGIVLEAATLVGVKLFNVESRGPLATGLESHLDSVKDKLALLPRSIRKQRKEVDDAF